MRIKSIFVTTALCIMVFSMAGAGQLKVPQDFQTIQSAIDNASNGDVVLVDSGTYTGPGNKNIDFHGKAITVVSKMGANVTIIDCENDGRGFQFTSNETSGSLLDGFTVMNGYVGGTTDNCGGGIFIDNASPTIENCIIINNTAFYQGGGIYANSATILNCEISGNTAENGSGGGVICWDSYVEDCNFSNNYTSKGGGGIQPHYSTIRRCNSTYNTADVGGGGIDNTGSEVYDCYIAWNYGKKAGGICFWLDQTYMTNCVIEGNTASDMAGGVGCYFYSEATIDNCVIIDNSGPESGGGIFCWGAHPVINNCVVVGNSATNAGGLGCVEESSPEVTNCILWNNYPDEINFKSGNGPIVSYSDIQNGWNGIGNIDQDPLFVTYQGHRYMLGIGSPCVDRGDPTISDRIYDWHPRWPVGFRDGSRSDMGAYGGPGNRGWID